MNFVIRGLILLAALLKTFANVAVLWDVMGCSWHEELVPLVRAEHERS
jgi:hypothetical protein